MPTTRTTTIGAALADARQRLTARSASAANDAQTLLSHITGQDKARLLAHPEWTLTAAEAADWEKALGWLEAGSPLPYVLGEWEFFGLPFGVAPGVLIPRPETELLVETALDWLRAHPDRRQAVDVGTGSGAIAIALATQVKDLQITAIEISEPALDVARANLQRHDLEERVSLVEGDLLAEVKGPFDLICANLPYIPTARLETLEVAQREPTLALDGGPDGLDLIGRLLAQTPLHLAPGGLLLAEVDDSHGDSASELARQHFPAAEIDVRPDLAGKARLLVLQT